MYRKVFLTIQNIIKEKIRRFKYMSKNSINNTKRQTKWGKKPATSVTKRYDISIKNLTLQKYEKLPPQ